MRLLALGGQHAAALAQYETCRRVLAEELNVEPSHETQALYESIRTRIDKDPADRPVPRRKLPPQTTPFVGREEELAQTRQHYWAIQLAGWSRWWGRAELAKPGWQCVPPRNANDSRMASISCRWWVWPQAIY